MGFFSKEAKKYKLSEQEVKDFSFQVIEEMFVGSAHFSDINFENVVKEAYHGNELVKAAIDEIIEGLLVCKLKAKDSKGNEVEQSVLQDLFTRTTLSQDELFNYLLLHYFLDGNGYWKLEMGRKVGKGAKILDIAPLMPHFTKIKGHPKKLISSYHYKVGAESERIFKPEEVLHLRHLDPESFIHGKSPLHAAFKQIDIDNEVSTSIKALEENQGRPGLILTHKGKLSANQQRSLKRDLIERFTGKRRGEPAVFHGDLSLLKEAFSPKEMEQMNVRRICETRILALLGVPGQLLGTFSGMERSIFSNMEAARLAFHDYTVTPLKEKLAKLLSRHKLLNPEGLTYYFDDEQTVVGQIKKRETEDRAKSMWNDGLMTRNEARALCGLDEVQEGDVFKSESVQNPLFAGLKKHDTKKSKSCSKGCCQSNIQSKTGKNKRADSKEMRGQGRKSIRNLSQSLGRIGLATEYYRRMKDWAKAELGQQKDEILALVEGFASDLEPKKLKKGETKNSKTNQFEESLETVAFGWEARSSRTVLPIMEGLVTGAAEQATVIELGLDFNIDPKEAREFIEQYSFKFAKKISETSAETVRQIVRQGVDEALPMIDIQRKLETKLGLNNKARAEMIAQTETIRAANAGAVNAYKDAGIEQLEWVASSEPCEFCEAMDGKIIGIEESFAALNDTVSGTQGGSMKLSYEETNHPPLHPGCQCTAVAVVKELD